MSIFVEKLLLCSDLILYGTLLLLRNKLLLILLRNKLLLVLLGIKLLL